MDKLLLIAKLPTTTLAYGSLKHLSHIIIELKKRQRNIAIYDDTFQLKTWLFCVRYHIPYYIPDCFKVEPANLETFHKYFEADLKTALDDAESKKYFAHKSYDFLPIIRSKIFPGMNKQIERWAKQEKLYEAILRDIDPSNVLVEEDFGGRAFFAAFMTSHNIPVHCISHANYMVDFEVPEADRMFGWG